MPPQMPPHSLKPLIFKITTLKCTVIVTVGTVLVKKKLINKLYIANDACDALGVHPFYVK